MNPQELRIGNTILRNGIVVTVDYQTFRDVEKYPDQYQGIELTEEWLIKFGFQKINKNVFRIEEDYEVTVKEDKVRFFICTYMDYPPSVSIKYAHQLQNLFYSLCGEELQLKN